MLKKCTLTKITDSGKVIALPMSMITEFNLQLNDIVTVYCGSASTKARVSQLPLGVGVNNRFVGLSSDCLTALSIPENISFKIKPFGQKGVRLGPVIGILTFPSHVQKRLSYYKCYARRNENNGLLYIFRGRGIDPQRKLISGFYFDYLTGTWKKGDFPYPDAVIDRLYPNAYVCHAQLEKVIGPAKIFNKKSMINKLDFARALGEDKNLAGFVPETRVFTGTSDLKHFLSKYKQVFLKPVNAMKGLGIVVVEALGNWQLNCLYTVHGKNFTKQLSSPEGIWDVLVSAAGRYRPYIIQQAIPRMEYQGGPFSIRSWAMKNGQGRWIMPGMFAKGTFGSGFLTNFTAGAKLIPLPELLKNIIPRLKYTRQELLQLIEDLTIRTGVALDNRFGPLGELGLDIVFDTGGNPWLIEANGNPGNIPIFQQREYPAWPGLVFSLPIDYATYLAGFSDRNKQN